MWSKQYIKNVQIQNGVVIGITSKHQTVVKRGNQMFIVKLYSNCLAAHPRKGIDDKDTVSIYMGVDWLFS